MKYVAINILVAATLIVIIGRFAFGVYTVRGTSMSPTLRTADRIIISKLRRTPSRIHRHDLVLLRRPDMPSIVIVKRVVGLPNESIEFRNGDIFINRQKLAEPYLPETRTISAHDETALLLRIEEHHYFVLGDNRDNSTDSRIFGPVNLKNILGKALFRYWPLKRLGRL